MSDMILVADNDSPASATGRPLAQRSPPDRWEPDPRRYRPADKPPPLSRDSHQW